MSISDSWGNIPGMEQPSEILSSGEVELRRWIAADLETLHETINESIEYLLPWMPWAASHDRQQVEKYLSHVADAWATGQAYQYAITTQGVVIGSCGLHRRIGPGGLEIGFWIHPAWAGKGLTTMAAAGLVEAGSRLPGIDRVEIHHDEANPASAAIARRLGFAEVERVTLPDGPQAPGEVGVTVVWRRGVPAG
ncbi:GNAT family N-acetyltransferase [Streptomyces sp. NPDC057889]|uniref:GNAT family N-acetyltransferase n=1 Tax=unclassified Streptomyces TaxID=2593676 RepID=UPI0036C37020